ncbi:MAG: hypothetical protein U1F56_03030 [Rubrivivax sp.]
MRLPSGETAGVRSHSGRSGSGAGSGAAAMAAWQAKTSQAMPKPMDRIIEAPS